MLGYHCLKSRIENQDFRLKFAKLGRFLALYWAYKRAAYKIKGVRCNFNSFEGRRKFTPKGSSLYTASTPVFKLT